MEHVSRPSYLPYEDVEPTSSRDRTAEPLTIGLPAPWWPFVGALASFAFSAVWMMDSWKAGKPLLGMTKINHLAQDAWGLLVTLCCCYAVFMFWKRRSGSLGLALCTLTAAAAMAWHRL
jgi:dolichyl-phosphate-mannose--protein O-mannosyl transferase